MATFISHSPAQTEALGLAWGRAARRGLVLGLSGELGAGKTQLVKGLARGLDIPARVQSPSFVLVNVYSGGRLPLFHLDLYRLDTPQQFVAAGLEEYLDPDGVTVIEWAERWARLRSARSEALRAEVNDCGAEQESRTSAGGLQPPSLPLAPRVSPLPPPRSSLNSQLSTLNSQPFSLASLRWVVIEAVGETERRITYEDFGD